MTTGVLLVLIMVASTLATLNLKRSGDNAYIAAAKMQSVMTDLYRCDNILWRSRYGAGEVMVARDRLNERVEAMHATIAEARNAFGDEENLNNLDKQIDVYHELTLEVVDLLAEDLQGIASITVGTEVNPQFEIVREMVEKEVDALEVVTQQRDRLIAYLLAANVLVTVTVTGALLWLFTRSEVRRLTVRRLDEQYRALVDQSSDLVLVCTPSGEITFLSPTAQRFADGFIASGSVDDIFELTHPQDRETLRRMLSIRGNSEEVHLPSGSTMRLGGPGQWRHFALSIRDLRDLPAVGGLAVTAHDVTERFQLQQRLSHQSLHDTLTGLPNRNLLSRDLDSLILDQRGNVGLVLLDLDRFKEVNDTLGHHIGDQLLIQVGRRLTGVLRSGDVVARLGGDEFVVLTPNAPTVNHLVGMAERIRTVLAETFHIEGIDLQVEASAGIVRCPDHGDDAATLLRRAEVAMYVAKSRSIGVFCYDPQADGHNPERLSLLADLRRALESTGLEDELVLFFQPQIRLSDRKVIGAEALIRWMHPSRGMVPPDQFIPLAEHTELIGPLTRHVLRMAIRQGAAWRAQGHDLTISVNLSARNLLDAHLDAAVAQELREHSFPAERLILEVTESAIISEPVRAIELLNRLHQQGLRLSIDDFGAGYTSLTHLKDLPLTELKIDGSFVKTMATERRNQTIVHGLVDLGHNLGLSTVAEGVENAESLAQLNRFGCDIVQGYHLSRPLPIKDFQTWLSESGAAKTGMPFLPAPRTETRSTAEPIGDTARN